MISDTQRNNPVLYEIWRAMNREAAICIRFDIKYKLPPREYVCKFFRDFERFVFWARIWGKFAPGLMLCRKDYMQPYCVENCFFTDDPHEVAKMHSFFKLNPELYEAIFIKKTRPPRRHTPRKYNTTPKPEPKPRREALRKMRLYNIWKGIKKRCLCPTCKDWPDYGGRGITICDEWRDNFAAFKEWADAHAYADFLSIDRIDVDGGYCPENCRWATDTEQALNQRGMPYRNLRLKAEDAVRFLSAYPQDCVVTIIVRLDKIPAAPLPVETDYD